jgi:hypothetical protein
VNRREFAPRRQCRPKGPSMLDRTDNRADAVRLPMVGQLGAAQQGEHDLPGLHRAVLEPGVSRDAARVAGAA